MLRQENAFMTLEAALLMSVILPALTALLIAGFYVHDQAVLQAGAHELTALGSCLRLEDTREASLKNELSSLTGGRLTWGRELSGQVNAGENTAAASITGTFPVPGFAAQLLSGGKLKLSAQSSRKIWHPAKIIWKIRGAKELIDIIRGQEH